MISYAFFSVTNKFYYSMTMSLDAQVYDKKATQTRITHQTNTQGLERKCLRACSYL